MILCFGTNMKQYGPFKHSLGGAGTTPPPHWYGSPGKIIGTVTINESKIEFLREYKRNFKFESYIDNLNFDNRKIVSRFRLSNHNLPIERLRYDNISREERLCGICDQNLLGNENHYMIWCQNYQLMKIREKFLSKVSKINPKITQLGENNIYILLG